LKAGAVAAVEARGACNGFIGHPLGSARQLMEPPNLSVITTTPHTI
jgi:hypothetical protein